MKKYFSVPAALVVISLLGAGCASGGSQPSPDSPRPSGSPTTGSGVSGRVADNAGCLNLYFPLKTGSAIEYSMDGATGKIPMKIAVTEHTSDSIKLSYTFTVKGVETVMTNELVCENGNIRGKGYFDFASRLSGLDISYETVKMEGEIIPSDLVVGREWVLDSEVVVHTNDARMQAILDGKHQTTHIVSKVVAEEDVTVPAGTFRALKIHQDITVDTGLGASLTTQGDAWYVKDVGLMKSQNTVNGTVSGMVATKITE